MRAVPTHPPPPDATQSRLSSTTDAIEQVSRPGPVLADVREIYRHLPSSQKRQLHVLLALMVLNTVAELGTIGAILPLLALIGHPESLGHYPWALDILGTVNAVTPREQLLTTTAVFAAFVILSGILRFQLSRSTFSFGYEVAHALTLAIQRRLLQQPYLFHVQRNTSTLISSIDKANILVFDVGLPLIQAVTAAFISLFVLAILLAVDPVTALTAAFAISSIYVAASALTRSRLAANSRMISRAIDERLKIVQESLGGIRDVLIDGSQESYLASFDRVNSKLGRARANTAIISSAPRFLIETVGIVVIAAIAFAASQRQGGFAAALPVLGAIAIGAQRLLPLLQQVYNGWSTASGYLSVVGQTAELLRLPVEPSRAQARAVEPLPLLDSISFENVTFSYPGRRRPALVDVSFDIPAASTVALVGETGSGKSTLADLLMGLLEPDQGRICIDGAPLTGKNRRSWQRSIAHVPQAIFLADTSIARNIALALADEPVDLGRVMDSARRAQLDDFVQSLPDGYDTIIGERGIRMSGGQRQRLGLARAIYKRAPVLVLDEATSALDEATEAAVIDALDDLRAQGRTIVIIAHRRSTIARSDIVVKLDKGRVVDVGKFAQSGLSGSGNAPAPAGKPKRGVGRPRGRKPVST